MANTEFRKLRAASVSLNRRQSEIRWFFQLVDSFLEKSLQNIPKKDRRRAPKEQIVLKEEPLWSLEAGFDSYSPCEPYVTLMYQGSSWLIQEFDLPASEIVMVYDNLDTVIEIARKFCAQFGCDKDFDSRISRLMDCLPPEEE